MMKHIIFCADDYGQNPTISQAIIELLRKNRLSATSCLVTSPDWLEQAAYLGPFKNSADIGLHFNLTEGKPLSCDFARVYEKFMPLSQLLKNAFLRRLDPVIIEKELHAQLDQFIQGAGQLPDFMDGHQHIHHFPVIRHVVVKVYEQRLRSRDAYVRCVHDPRVFWRIRDSGYVKRMMIEFSGAYAFKRLLVKHRIPHNASFAGIYDFADAKEYAAIFPRFLSQNQEGGLIMCHPGLQSQDENDPIAAARFQEYQYFLTQEYSRVCDANQVVVGRLKK